jgi:non-heme chloroperoxidase
MKPILTAIVAIPFLICGMAFATAAQENNASMSKSGFVTASDGAKIHYINVGARIVYVEPETPGQPGGSFDTGVAVVSGHPRPTILFVPGWTMPAWIWQQQIDHFAANYHVVAIDPRCQGESSQTADGLYPAQMARDIKAVVDQLHLAPVVLVGWSMAVVETLSYVDQFGTRGVAGLVFVDELAGGFAPGEAEQDFSLLKGLLGDRAKTADFFVRKVQFHKPQPEEYIQRVIQASLSVPTASAVALLVGRYAADYRALLPKIDKPTLVCAAKSFYFDRVVDMQKQIPGSRLEIFEGAGHALFVDNPDQFNSALDSFLSALK